MTEASPALLAVEELTAGYEPGVPIVNGASLKVAAGEILAVLGPNGAGKSTVVKAMAGLVPVVGGTVRLGGADITRMPAHRRLGAGLAFVPQTENVFASLSVADNLRIAGDRLADRRAARAGSRRSTTTSRTSPASAACPPGGCPAGSARCSPWRAPSWPRRRCCCSTSPRPACRRSSSARSSAGSPRSATPASPSSWWSRTSGPPSPSPTGPWCSWTAAKRHEGPAAGFADDPLVADLFLGGRGGAARSRAAGIRA